MRNTISPVLFAMACAAATPAMADDTQYWQTVTVNVALPDSFKLQNEVVLRSSDARGFYQFQNTLMAGKKVSKVTTLWLGYTFTTLYDHGTFTSREHRFRQQVNFDGFAVAGKVKFSSRVRLEQRWREGRTGTGWRLRPQIKASTPLAGKTTISVASEAIINLNNTGFQTKDGVDRLRTSVSIGVPLTKAVSMDFGYLNQHTFVNAAPDTDDHVLTLGLSASF